MLQPTWVVVISHPVGALKEQRIRSGISSHRSHYTKAELMRVDIAVPQLQFVTN
jgi:hypothetical protein